jgi:hypothetical protein
MYTTTTTETLTIVLEGTEQVLSFRAKLALSKHDITSVSWHQTYNDWPDLMIRMPGSYLPSWIMAGSYWTESGWFFVLAKKPKGMLQPTLFDVLVIETKKERYARVVVRMKREQAEEIIRWWKEVKSEADVA